MPEMKRWRVAVALAGLLLGGCGGEGGEVAPGNGECRELKIVVTTSILGDIVGNVAGGAGGVEAAWFVEPPPFPADPGGEAPTDHGTLDPHIWTDPVRMADVATGLGEALAAVDAACPERGRGAAAGDRRGRGGRAG